jgi:adenylyl- and sulfurtransferase ThiI
MSERATPRERQHVAGTVLVIPFSELGTKSEASRAKMLDQLLTNIKHTLKDVFHVPWVKYRTPGERLVFSFRKEDVDTAMEALQHVPGILRLQACVETQPRAETIAKKVSELVEQGALAFDGSALEVRALFFHDRREKDALVEGVVAILQEQAHQRHGQLAQQESNNIPLPGTYIEMHPAFAYVALEHREGLNGNPVGTQNPVVAEIVGRGGDLLAALLAAKRGIVLTPVFFSIGTFAFDPRRYKEMLSGIKRGIDAFHSFPVKKYFYVPFDGVLSMLVEKEPSVMNEHPCTCCIVARRAILNSIITHNTMINFAIQGTAFVPIGLQLDSCPFEASIDPATNPDGLFLVSPLLTGTQEMPHVFSGHLARLPEPPEKVKGYTWSFCKLRSRDLVGTMARQDILTVHDLVKHLARERAKDLIIPVGADLPFRV